MNRPNILIFMTDQEQAQVVQPDHPCRTPNAERLASEGIRFDRAYTVAAHCCPSRATFFTGLYPSRHGVFNNVKTVTAIHEGLNPGVATFGEALRDAGYRMRFSGKWHVTNVEDPSDRGWEELYVTAGRGARHEIDYDAWAQRARSQSEPTEPRPRGVLRRPDWGDYRLYGASAPRPESDPYHPGDLRVVNDAVTALSELAEEARPWCLYVGTIGPHDPYIVPERYATMHDPADVPLPSSYSDDLEDKPRVYRRQRRFWSQLTDDEVRESIAHYWGYCAMQDDFLGMILDALEATRQADNTVVVFTSDHGDLVGAHGLYLKGVAAFDEAYHLPLIVRWRDGIASPGRAVDEFVTFADFAPTFLELAGASLEGDLSGSSFVPFLDGATPSDWRDAFHSQFNGVELYYSQRIVQTKRWKYVYNGFDDDELYCLEADPLEMTNLIGNVQYDNVVREMCGRMWQFAAKERDTIHNPDPTVSLAPYGPMAGFE